MQEVYIYDSLRTPRGRGNDKGALSGTTATSLLCTLLEALPQRLPGFEPKQVEDLILGCVSPVGEQGANIAKTAAQHSGYGDQLTGVTLNRFCGSGLEAINQAAAYIRAEYQNLILAGGVESMSRVPIGSDGGAVSVDPSVAIPGRFVPQGISADLIAAKYGYSREQVDLFGFESQQKAAKAWAEGRFTRAIVPVYDRNGLLLLDRDENVRPDTSLEGLGQLKPAFAPLGAAGFDAVALARYPELSSIPHIHHAGNSSAIVDGAALTLLGNRAAGEAMGLKPRARIRSVATCGTEPTIMLLGPAPASEIALRKAGMKASDIDLFEVNEAFASVVLYYIQHLGIDPAKVNVNGGAIALGHPLGATGCMLLGTVLDELERRDLQTGLISLCIGGGMGIATIIERV